MTALCQLIPRAVLAEQMHLDQAMVTLIESAFRALVLEDCVMPPVLGMKIADRAGEVDVKTAYWPSRDHFAIKISPGFFNNPALGLPSLNGLMVVLSSQTGRTRAILLDNGLLTDLRTAAAGGVVARHLAPNHDSLGLVGAGRQARLQLDAFLLERSVTTIHLWARDLAKAVALKAAIEVDYAQPVVIHDRLESLCKQSRSIITTTPAHEPLIQGAWITTGQHLTAMGSDAPDKRELDDHCLRQADLIVVDQRTQSETRGELRPLDATDREALPIRELPELLVNGIDRDPHWITVCDLTGTGIQDTAIAELALSRCQKAPGVIDLLLD